MREADIEPGDVLDEPPVESEESESAGEYEQTGSLGLGTQGDSIARELAERERRSDSYDMDDRATLVQARSLLVLLLATCEQTQTALGAAANALDTDMAELLDAMIERTEAELNALVKKIDALPA